MLRGVAHTLCFVPPRRSYSPQVPPASSCFLVERDQALLSYTFTKLPNVFRRLFKGIWKLGFEFKGTNLLSEIPVLKFKFYYSKIKFLIRFA